ncbi:hypothetical protein [Parvicella tangerina]|uniref:Uncharacterized protein n=1 Tax=Parvicella tangerina TaxID=2829795 RepID=A0A916JQS8_9FLAO|nr:hypothetical protein [Parvicella tangerina]CAG5086832.1 hypothetical protein CRYO30217_03298 [Parvicella tangerina]
MNVIGVYTLFAPELLERLDCSLEELKQSRIEWGRVFFEENKPVREENFMNDMLNGNRTTIEEYDNVTGIIKLAFEHPVPLDIIKEKFEYFIPVFEDDSV